MIKNRWKEPSGTISGNFPANSLDSLATSSNQSESPSEDSDSETKGSFSVKCEVYAAQGSCGSLRSWGGSSKDGENSYEYVGNDNKGVKMETIPEEEPKVSVKEILARFENLKEKNGKDCNNNNCAVSTASSGSSNGNSNEVMCAGIN